MSYSQRIVKFYREKRILIAGFVLITSTHWMWLKLQDNPRLVPPAERKGLPIVEAFKKVSEVVVNKWKHTEPSEPTK